ncbi:DNA repair protein RecO [Mycoplasma simbae]|uniref:DNA repair protein RecO n=1 Tax=Mycoplasma simbae TaxID=36744 RepID=UPI000495BF82|nr:recombination protein O N-terminal domain-containing protein [Mycoplasma simbae]
MAEVITQAIVVNIEQSNTSINDSFVDFLTPNSSFRLLAKGINKASSKNRVNLQVGCIVEIEYFKARKKGAIGRLKKASLLEGIDFSNRLNLIFVAKAIKFIEQIKTKTFSVFNAYTQIIKRLGEGINKKLLLFLYTSGLASYGIKPVVEQCCECGQAYNLCDFAFHKGGFLCFAHSQNVRWNKELKSIYFMFKDLTKFIMMCNDAIAEILMQELLQHYHDNGIYVEQ